MFVLLELCLTCSFITKKNVLASLESVWLNLKAGQTALKVDF